MFLLAFMEISVLDMIFNHISLHLPKRTARDTMEIHVLNWASQIQDPNLLTIDKWCSKMLSKEEWKHFAAVTEVGGASAGFKGLKILDSRTVCGYTYCHWCLHTEGPIHA